MVMCAVFSCKHTNRQQIQGSISYFSFPKNEKLKKKWVAFCKRKDEFLLRTSRICSIHFKKEDIANHMAYDLGFVNSRQLKPGAIPSIYPEIKNIPCSQKSRKKQARKNHRTVATTTTVFKATNNYSTEEEPVVFLNNYGDNQSFDYQIETIEEPVDRMTDSVQNEDYIFYIDTNIEDPGDNNTAYNNNENHDNHIDTIKEEPPNSITDYEDNKEYEILAQAIKEEPVEEITDYEDSREFIHIDCNANLKKLSNEVASLKIQLNKLKQENLFLKSEATEKESLLAGVNQELTKVHNENNKLKLRLEKYKKLKYHTSLY